MLMNRERTAWIITIMLACLAGLAVIWFAFNLVFQIPLIRWLPDLASIGPADYSVDALAYLLPLDEALLAKVQADQAGIDIQKDLLTIKSGLPEPVVYEPGAPGEIPMPSPGNPAATPLTSATPQPPSSSTAPPPTSTAVVGASGTPTPTSLPGASSTPGVTHTPGFTRTPTRLATLPPAATRTHTPEPTKTLPLPSPTATPTWTSTATLPPTPIPTLTRTPLPTAPPYPAPATSTPLPTATQDPYP